MHRLSFASLGTSGITKACSEGPEKNKELSELFNRLWTAVDELRANSKLRSTQYSTPVLGILFVRYADYTRAQDFAKFLLKV